MKTCRTIACGLFAVLLAAAAAGCPELERTKHVRIYGMTGPPPARVAMITNDEYDDVHAVQLSVGVALAVSCRDSCDSFCIAPRFVVGDPDLLEVHESYYVSSGGSGFVLVGKAPGTTTLRVITFCAEQLYTVEVMPGGTL